MSEREKPKVTARQLKLIKGIVDGKSMLESAKAAHFTGSNVSIRANARKEIKKPHVREALSKALEKHGLTLDVLVNKIREGIEAKKTQFFSDKGHVTDERECIDYPTRKEYAEIGLRLHRVIGPQAEEETGATINIGQFLAIIDDGRKERGLPPIE